MKNDRNRKKELAQIDRGKFINGLEDKDLSRYQKLKTIFMLLSTLFFAVSLFLKVEGREKLADIIWATTLYVILDIVMIAASVYVSYQGSKGQKIRKEVPFRESPHYGYKPFTYVSYEIFNLLHIGFLAIDIALLIYSVGVWGIINVIMLVLSAGFSIVSRQYLYIANSKNMTFVPPIEPDIVPDEETPLKTEKNTSEENLENK